MKKLLLVLFFTMFPVLAHGTTYYVSPSGSNGNSCVRAQNSSTPKQTINNGANCLGSGDTLVVKAGTYNEVLNMNNYPNGSSGSPTTIRSEVQGGAVLKPSAGGAAIYFGGGGANKQWMTIDGLVLD